MAENETKVKDLYEPEEEEEDDDDDDEFADENEISHIQKLQNDKCIIPLKLCMDTFKLESSDYKIKRHIEVCHKSSLSPGGIFPKKLLADIGMD